MKKQIIITLLASTVWLPGLLSAQNNPIANAPKLMAPIGASEKREPAPEPGQGLPRFDLNFPGGTPGALVQALQRATGRPLNVIIRDDQADVTIPQLNMKGVTLTELFTALGEASKKQVNQITGTYFGGINGQASSQYQTTSDYYTFTTKDYPPREDSIWYFVHNVPPPPPGSPRAEEAKTSVRYFQLSPYLETYKVEDITTAIETGWWMQTGHNGPMPKPGTIWGMQPNEDPMPRLSFHKDTKLLIAVGDPEKLKAIDAVLDQLQPRVIKSKPAAGQQSQAPAKSGESDKQ